MTDKDKIIQIIGAAIHGEVCQSIGVIADKILSALNEKQPAHKCWVNEADPTNMGFCAICGKTPPEEKQEVCKDNPEQPKKIEPLDKEFTLHTGFFKVETINTNEIMIVKDKINELVEAYNRRVE